MSSLVYLQLAKASLMIDLGQRELDQGKFIAANTTCCPLYSLCVKPF